MSVNFNATQFSGGWDNDDLFNLEAPNGHIINLVNAKGGSGSTGGFVNTNISSAGTIPIPATGAPYTGTYAADTILGTGPAGYASDSTTWSALYSTGSPNGTWNFIGAYLYTSGSTTVNSWSLTINYTVPASYTWAATTGLYTNSSASAAYTGTSSDSVYALPTALTTYTLTAANGACHSTANATVSVNPIPASITGSANVCIGSTTTLSSTTAGGTWSSSSTNATIGSISGIVNGASLGAATITYTLSTGCFVTTVVTVNPLPSSITGTTNVCVSSTTTLADAGGGTWSSNDITKASVGSSSGIVTGVAAGNTTITYTLATGCTATTPITVNPLPAAITGTVNVCAGATTTLSDITASGVWTSSTPSLATIGSSTGIVNGILAGSPVISYTLPTGCMVTAAITVNPLPAPIAGTVNVCVGATGTLSGTGGGTWSSSDITKATVGSASGIVTGVAAGNPTITYTLPTGCFATTQVTVNPLPATITGTLNVCIGVTTTVTDATGGGTWSSGDITKATIGSGTGIITGVATGTPPITYMLPTGCLTTSVLTVNTLPAAISGTANICVASTTTLTDLTTGGAWSSNNTSFALIGSGTGLVLGVSAGSTTISYTLPTGCSVGFPVTVNALPAAIGGPSLVCTGSAATLTDATAGGLWNSSNVAIASIGTGSGIVNGLITGTVTVTYTLTGGCFITKPLTINTSPAPIVGTFTLCAGQSTPLSEVTTGGTWSSSNATLGSVSTGGVFTGVAAGTPIISYSISSGCVSIANTTVYALPAVHSVTGGGGYCTGGSGLHVGLNGSDLGINYQLYIGGITATGTPVAGTGLPLDFGLQSATGTYTVIGTSASGLCTTNMTGSAVISINSLPTVFTLFGGGSLCTGGTGADIGLGGSTPGTSYQLYNFSTPVGAPITGVGASIDFGLQTLAGPYNAVATNLATGCSIPMSGTANVTVNPLPTPYIVSGDGSYCSGGAGVHIFLNNSGIGINYQLFNAGVPSGISVAGTGSALDFGLRTATGTYTVVGTNSSTGCVASMSGATTVTINPLPALFIMTGGGSYCTGGTGNLVGLSGSATGISYQLSLAGSPIGSPLPGTGAPLSFGSQTLGGTYTVTATNTATGCTSTMSGTSSVLVNALPTVFTVTGGGAYCLGGTGVTIGLNSSQTGTTYQLYCGITPVGSVVAGTGAAISFGAAFTTAGSYNVVATSSTGCISNMFGSASVSVTPLPLAFTVGSSATSYCSGGSGVHITLSGSVSGTTYSLYNGTTLVGAASGTGASLDFGVVFAAGTYTVAATNTTTLCTANMTGSAVITVNPLPTVYPVTGGGNYCSGSTAPTIGLSGSNSGISYQLNRSGIPVGSAVAGTGSSISFGPQAIAGSYSVVAVNSSTGCVNNMTGSASVAILPLPAVYTVTGGGNYCTGTAGVHVGLSFSNLGISYQLYNGAASGAPVTGTGSSIDFGLQTASGSYTIVGTNTASACNNNMSGSAVITANTPPASYSVTGGGTYCAGGAGSVVGLSNSATGVNYQLYLGTTAIGSPAAGTGSAISVATATTPGIYTVIATGTSSGCIANMTGSASVSIAPLPTSFIVTGGGSYCTGGTGISVGLNSSTTGVNYQLYNGGMPVTGAVMAGTGFTLNFGMQTATGTYTIAGTNTVTSCTNMMSGSATVSTTSLPVIFRVNGGGDYCTGGSGVPINLNGSAIGISYQLYVGGTLAGSPVAGTGSPLDFGLQTAPGLYIAIATNPSTGCSDTMLSSATVVTDALPALHNVIGGGNYCPGGTGVDIGLNGSNTGISYQLYNGSLLTGAAITGTGAPIDFGMRTSGTYTVVATSLSAGCTSAMTGSAVVGTSALPNIYNVTGGGNYCPSGTGVAVGLSGSAVGITYQLFNGGASGTLLTGTGGPLNFGLQTATGTYTVLATSFATTCSVNMNGTATIGISPLPTAHIITGGRCLLHRWCGSPHRP